MNKHTYSGSALIIVILMTNILLLLILAINYGNNRIFNMAYLKERYEYQFHLTEGALQYGSAYVSHLQIMQKKNAKKKQPQFFKPGVFDLGKWPPHSMSNSLLLYSARLIITPATNLVHIRSELLEQQKVCCAMSCVLDQGVTRGWKIETIE